MSSSSTSSSMSSSSTSSSSLRLRFVVFVAVEHQILLPVVRKHRARRFRATRRPRSPRRRLRRRRSPRPRSPRPPLFPLLLPGRERVPVHVSVPKLVLVRERLVLVDLLILEVARQILELGLTLPERIILRLGSTGVILVLAVHVVVALLLVRGGVALGNLRLAQRARFRLFVRPPPPPAGAPPAPGAFDATRPPRFIAGLRSRAAPFAGLRGGIAKTNYSYEGLSCASASARAPPPGGSIAKFSAESSETAETDVGRDETHRDF